MEKLKTTPALLSPKADPAPQLRVKSGVQAGASLSACMDKLNYWRNQYYNRCGYIPPYPY
jgi:hypothetical protein